jgi:ABC-type branched-subunit amino acid transport system substrate-binding protein
VTATSIKIGALATMTGPATSVWADGVAGAKARFDRANAEGGVNGRRIDFAGVQDDGLDPTRNSNAARALAENQQVFAVAPVLTPLPNWETTFCQDVVPAVGFAFNRGFCDSYNTFGYNGCLLPDPGLYASAASSFDPVLPPGASKTIALEGNADASAVAGNKTLKVDFQQAGWKVVHVGNDLPDSGPLSDPSPVVNALMTSNAGQPPSVVYWVADFANTVAMTQALNAAGYKGLQVNAAGYDPRIAGLKAFQGSYTNLQWLPFEATNNSFVQQMTADLKQYAPGTTLGIQAAAGYISADFLIKAIEAAGPNLTVNGFLKTANSPSFTYGGHGFIGETHWPDNHFVGSPCGTMVQDTGGKYGLVVPLTCGTAFNQ